MKAYKGKISKELAEKLKKKAKEGKLKGKVKVNMPKKPKALASTKGKSKA